MSNTGTQINHEVFVNPNAERIRLLLRAGIVLFAVLVAGAGYSFLNKERTANSSIQAITDNQVGEPTNTPPAEVHWYTDAPIEKMTFSGFLSASEEDQYSISARYLSDSLWKEYLSGNVHHGDLRPYALKLTRLTYLMVASDVPFDAKISDVFATITAKKENTQKLRPPR